MGSFQLVEEKNSCWTVRRKSHTCDFPFNSDRLNSSGQSVNIVFILSFHAEEEFVPIKFQKSFRKRGLMIDEHMWKCVSQFGIW